jgi:hypothetical protein
MQPIVVNTATSAPSGRSRQKLLSGANAEQGWLKCETC